MSRKAIHILLVLLAFAIALPADNGAVGRNTYQTLVVMPLEFEPGAELPNEYRENILFDIRSHLTKAGLFQKVLAEDQVASAVPESTLHLITTITKYNRGSQAKRYFIGFGAGQTKIVAKIRYVEPATGKTVFERQVDGKVVMGILGGDSKGATNGLAKEVAKVTKKWLEQ
jgi:hypothetical protein